MIFITLGSQKFQFNRLLEAVDKLIEQGWITDPVFAQIGASDYQPKNFEFQPFLTRKLFQSMIHEASVILTHGGSGAIVSGLKAHKKVIAVPRLQCYGEHIDNHQIQIVESFAKTGYIIAVTELSELAATITAIEEQKLKTFQSNNEHFIQNLSMLLEDNHA
ncbi:PssE/Cps14G family polysaccharide biosynthesis glycosyltransferase [Candidatus Enterococcus courvalinii]|uniref:Beta(1,3)galactosyltransferase EpsH n=1 Tax=Candidatus Enterococcus courvalinii TaxID=2815329 RepID=A0ABS3HX21_9ENTE|nr:PssE/Cps14G family polysaccharide biosynthesis glycosyltransferase [Enterococcus sp. MSG2901]MBO0481009.1 beta(1,3)galactosyltransferase EpsH [Enterococcus sp. MSG2901]